MKWQECFRKSKYISLLQNKSDFYKFPLALFMDEEHMPEELLEVYLSDRGDEMFFILRVIEDVNISELCEKWDKKILSFINFGIHIGFPSDVMNKIEYNIIQILLCSSDCDKKVEKSISVSRKIILTCGKEDELEESQQLLLPFWYEQLVEPVHDSNEVSPLETLLPTNEELPFLYQKRDKLDRRASHVTDENMNFTEEEFKAVKGWLEK